MISGEMHDLFMTECATKKQVSSWNVDKSSYLKMNVSKKGRLFPFLIEGMASGTDQITL